MWARVRRAWNGALLDCVLCLTWKDLEADARERKDAGEVPRPAPITWQHTAFELTLAHRVDLARLYRALGLHFEHLLERLHFQPGDGLDLPFSWQPREQRAMAPLPYGDPRAVRVAFRPEETSKVRLRVFNPDHVAELMHSEEELRAWLAHFAIPAYPDYPALPVYPAIPA